MVLRILFTRQWKTVVPEKQTRWALQLPLLTSCRVFISQLRGKPCTYQQKWRWNWEFGEVKIARAFRENARGGYSFLKNFKILQRITVKCLAEFWSRHACEARIRNTHRSYKEQSLEHIQGQEYFSLPTSRVENLTSHMALGTIVQRVLLHLCNE